jgi:hypothetical protein
VTAEDQGETVKDWRELCAEVKALPLGQLWRHNEAGDLPGRGQVIDQLRLLELVRANAGRRGFTYTHKPMLGRQWLRGGSKAGIGVVLKNRAAIEESNRNGFTVNLSADSLGEADELAKLGPTVVTLPHDAPTKGLRTPGGRHVVVCPAETHEHVTCASCGLCAVAKRKSIVGFRAHGNNRLMVTTRLRQLPLFPGQSIGKESYP